MRDGGGGVGAGGHEALFSRARRALLTVLLLLEWLFLLCDIETPKITEDVLPFRYLRRHHRGAVLGLAEQGAEMKAVFSVV